MLFHIKRAFTRIFSIRGRASRLEYNFALLLCAIIWLFLFVGISTGFIVVVRDMPVSTLNKLTGNLSYHKIFEVNADTILSFMLFVLSLIIWFTANVRRKHDLGFGFWWSGWSFSNPLPTPGQLSFKKGDSSPNEYGLSPEWEEKGITSEEEIKIAEDNR